MRDLLPGWSTRSPSSSWSTPSSSSWRTGHNHHHGVHHHHHHGGQGHHHHYLLSPKPQRTNMCDHHHSLIIVDDLYEILSCLDTGCGRGAARVGDGGAVLGEQADARSQGLQTKRNTNIFTHPVPPFSFTKITRLDCGEGVNL